MLRKILEELVSQGWFGNGTGKTVATIVTEGNFFDQKEDVDREVNKALSAIQKEIENCVPERKKFFAILSSKNINLPGQLKECRTVDDWIKFGYNKAIDNFKSKLSEKFIESRIELEK